MESLRGELIEGIIQESEDETLMDRYLSGEEIDPKVLIEDLEKAVARGSFYPVLAVSSPRGIGMAELLEVMTQAFPSPEEHPMPAVSTLDGRPVDGLSCDPAGPLLAEVVKTTSDPYVGRVSLVRVFSGTLRADAAVHVSGHGRGEQGHADHDTDERIGALTCPLGKQQRAVTEAVAGDICAVAKLATAETGDTLSSKDEPLLMEPWVMPEPLLPIAVSAKSKADDDKMSQALSRLVAEDPTLRLEINPETHQLVLWCMGEAHVDVLLDRLSNRYGVAVETSPPRVPLRETVAGKASGLGRNVKQTGGHGEFAICRIDVEPLPSGAGFEFVDKVVGGVVPRQFIPSVEKGVRSQMEQGVVAGYPMVGLQVTLYDGKAHSVDSSDMAFQKAGRAALRDAVEKAQSMLLEPVDEVSILVPDDYVGAVMSDLSSRRGRGAGHRAGAGRPDAGQGRGPGAGDHPVHDRPAVGVPRHRLVQPFLPAPRAAAVPPGRQGGGRDANGCSGDAAPSGVAMATDAVTSALAVQRRVADGAARDGLCRWPRLRRGACGCRGGVRAGPGSGRRPA